MLSQIKCRPFVLLVIALALSVVWSPAISSAQDATGQDWLPAPTGPYQVGTTTYHWVNEARDEMLTDDPNDKREIIVRLWYPANAEPGATPLTYLPHGEMEAAHFEARLTSMDLTTASPVSEWVLAPTHSFPDAPLSDAHPTYPVLVFSPGLPGMPLDATGHIQELASHGYIVAAINHTYISGWTVFPDGDVVSTLCCENLPESVWPLMEDQGALDQSFVLDQLELLNADTTEARFAGRLDLDRVGTFGISWGAWIAPLSALNDSRFKAVLSQGPHATLPALVRNSGLDLPFMIMDPAGQTSIVALQKMRGPTVQLIMRDISGFAFGDGLSLPGFWDGLTSFQRRKVEPQRANEVINAYALAFFNHYLKGEESSLLVEDSSDYPEVQVSARNM